MNIVASVERYELQDHHHIVPRNGWYVGGSTRLCDLTSLDSFVWVFNRDKRYGNNRQRTNGLKINIQF